MAHPDTALAAKAWEMSYLDPAAARALGERLAHGGGPGAADGWLHLALAEVRCGAPEQAASALQRARELYVAQGSLGARAGLALCDEVQAIALRRQGDTLAAAQLQAQADARARAHPLPQPPVVRFLARNARAVTAQLQGQWEAALRHAYAAFDAALETGWAGPQCTATANLGALHLAMFNLEDARQFCEAALRAARSAGARAIVGGAAANLVRIHHALGEPERARAMAEFMATHAHEMDKGALETHALALALGDLAAGETDSALGHLQALLPDAETAPVGSAARCHATLPGLVFGAWIKARCLLAAGDPAAARVLADQTLQRRPQRAPNVAAFDLAQLYLVLADASETVGDMQTALACMRQAHGFQEILVAQAARARRVALELGAVPGNDPGDVEAAARTRGAGEEHNSRMGELQRALQAQVANNETLQARLREQALHDPLTGLHNRRYLYETAPGMLELARRQGGPLCVVQIDLDHFRQLNEAYGQAAGDLMLRRFAALLRGMLRKSDLVCRHGGEEFVAVMPDIDAEGAYLMLGRLLEAFVGEQLHVGDALLPPGSFSAGIALFPGHGDTVEHLLQRADLALYAAKGLGRARIEIAHAGSMPALN